MYHIWADVKLVYILPYCILCVNHWKSLKYVFAHTWLALNTPLEIRILSRHNLHTVTIYMGRIVRIRDMRK